MLNNFVNFYHNLDKKFKVIFWVVFIDLIIIITLAVIFFIYRLNNEPRNITITNWDEITTNETTMPQGFHKATEQEITSILTNYNKISPDTKADATIRDKTYYAAKNNSSGAVNISFIVDIESLQHSFEVKFSYNSNLSKHNDGELQVIISCPYASDIKYINTKCLSSNNPFNEAVKYLPYTGKLPNSGAKVTIKNQTYGSNSQHPNSSYLAVSVNSCDNSAIVSEGKDFIQSWLKERYLDPNDFYYEVFNTCEV